jgi:hypothetical protein
MGWTTFWAIFSQTHLVTLTSQILERKEGEPIIFVYTVVNLKAKKCLFIRLRKRPEYVGKTGAPPTSHLRG